MHKNIALLGLAITVAIIVIFAAIIYSNYPQTTSECDQSSDCVPAQCCHPTTCISKDKAPDCNDVMCTMECKPGTMDCGQGSCICGKGVCRALLNE